MDNKMALQMIGHRIVGVQARVFDSKMESNLRSSGLQGSSWLTQERADVEIRRLKAARDDVLSHMSKEDVATVQDAIAADDAARKARNEGQFNKLMKK